MRMTIKVDNYFVRCNLEEKQPTFKEFILMYKKNTTQLCNLNFGRNEVGCNLTLLRVKLQPTFVFTLYEKTSNKKPRLAPGRWECRD